MSLVTSVWCDHGRPGPDRCPARFDVQSPGLPDRLIRGEARRAGWAESRRGEDWCPDHRGGRPRP